MNGNKPRVTTLPGQGNQQGLFERLAGTLDLKAAINTAHQLTHVDTVKARRHLDWLESNISADGAVDHAPHFDLSRRTLEAVEAFQKQLGAENSARLCNMDSGKHPDATKG